MAPWSIEPIGASVCRCLLLLLAAAASFAAAEPTMQNPVDNTVYVNREINYFIMGSGLSTGFAGDPDTLRFVTAGSSCDSGAAGGTSDITGFAKLPTDTILDPDNLMFTAPGEYHVCHKTSGQSSFTLLDTSKFHMTVNGPTSFSPLSMATGEATTVSFYGHNLNRGSGADSVKLVASTASTCSSPTITQNESPLEFTDLGPDDVTSSTTSTLEATITTPGEYKICYKPSGAHDYAFVSGLLSVNGVSTISTTSSSMGVSNELVFSGRGLSRANGGDAVKFVVGTVSSNSDCDNAAAVMGTGTECTDFLPDDATNVETVIVHVTFTAGGTFKVCYKLSGGSYHLLDGISVTVKGPDSVIASSTTLQTNADELFTITGTDLDTREFGDSVKFVDATSTDCSGAPAQGTSAVTDLGPNDAAAQSAAEATVRFSYPGDYKLCYKVKGVAAFVLQPTVFTVTQSDNDL